MSEDYIHYRMAESGRYTKPSEDTRKKPAKQSVSARTSSTQPSDKAVVYSRTNTSYNHTRYVHKSNKKSV